MPRSHSPELKPIQMQTYDKQVNIVTCDNCKQVVVVIFGSHPTGKRDNRVLKIDLTYPVISDLASPLGVSQKIWGDYAEGKKCLAFGAPKGAVVLFRRATQSLMKELGADPKKKLMIQISDLKQNGIITKNLYDLATELRLWGNFGAHPNDDLLDDVPMKEAQEMEYLFIQSLRYTVIYDRWRKFPIPGWWEIIQNQFITILTTKN